ncbi:MAG: hypothetical protein ACPL2E_07895, partial [Conexivisphaera sp.]
SRELALGVLRNVISHPLAFLTYEQRTGFFATKSVLKFLAGGGSGVPALDSPDIRLLRAWRNSPSSTVTAALRGSSL